MSEIKKNYNQVVKEEMPKSKHLKNAIMAFIFGGAICTIGHGINVFAKSVLSLDTVGAASLQAIVLVFCGAMLTGIGVYDKLGAIAGAGTVVPITGFANSIVAPAMEFKREGLVMGTGGKMFVLAGPVLVYGISVSVIIGLIYCVIG